MSEKRDFFISYTRANQDWANWIAWQLEQEHYTCFVQSADVVAGQDFVRRMKEALDGARQMIAVLSSEYFESDLAQKELQAAYAADMALPVRVDRCRIPKLFRSSVYIDLVGLDIDAARRALLEGVAASRLGRRALTNVPFPGRPAIARGASEEPGSRAAARRRKRRLKILFIGAEADTGLDLRGEYRSIRAVVRESRHRDAIALKGVFNATVETLFSTLNRFSPDVFHLAGKQDAGRILLDNGSGGVAAIPESALCGMFRALDRGIRLVVLDTRSSLRAAREITKTVDCAIGVRNLIFDDEAIAFYTAFYRAVAAGRSIRDACGQAEAYARMKGVPKSHIPQLRCRATVDAAALRLVPGDEASSADGEPQPSSPAATTPATAR